MSDYDLFEYVNSSSYFNFTNFEMADFSELDYGESPIMRIVSGIFLFFLILVGIFGNLLLLHIILLKWKIQTAFNLFIANLAIADILYTVPTAINLMSHMFFGKFMFGNTMCRTLAFFEYFGPILSIFIIIAALVVLQFQVKIVLSSIVIVFLYILASLPAFMQSNLFETFSYSITDEENVTLCVKSYPNLDASITLDELDKVLQIKLPIFVLAIYFVLWIIQKLVIGVKTLGEFVYIKLLIIMAITYIILWTPALYIIQNMEDWGIKHSLIIFYVAHFLCGLAVIFKPFLYMFMHEGIQREFQKFLHANPQSNDRSRFMSNSYYAA